MKTAILFFACIALLCSSNLLSQTITIDINTEYQTIIGFGGHNPNGQVDMLTDDLGMSIQRCWLAYQFEPFNDNSDPSSANTSGFHFNNATNTSVSDLIALKNKGVKYFMAVPWSPPAWMKDNGSTINGGHVNPYLYDELVEFFVQFIKEFEVEVGIPLYAISIQNEPRFDQSYTSAQYTPQEMAEVVKRLGRRLETEGLDTKIVVAEDMGSASIFSDWFRVMVENDLECRKYVDIFSVHGYLDGYTASGDAAGWMSMALKCKEYDIPLWMTETSGYNTIGWEEGNIDLPGNPEESGVKPGAFDLANDIFEALYYGNLEAWMWWRINIDWAGGWLDECLSYGSTKTKAYYSSKNFYKYIRPGAVRVESISSHDSIDVVAFKNPEEGQFSLVILNKDNIAHTINFDFGSANMPGSFDVYRSSSIDNCISAGTVSNNSFDLPARSVTSLVYQGGNIGPTIDEIENLVVVSTAGSQTINLTGISDGDGGGQTVSITASSSNTSIIPNPIVNYSTGSTGSINYTPVSGQSGEVSITVTLADDGDNTGGLNARTEEFRIKVIPFVNNAPTLTTVADFTVYIDDGQQSVDLPGLTDGNDGSQTITASAESQSSIVLEVASIVSGDKIVFYTVPHYAGLVPITLTIKDDGGIDLGGVDTKTITFNILVEEGSGGGSGVGIDNKENFITIFPNPVSEQLNIETPFAISAFSIYSSTGSILINKKGAIQPQLDVSNLNSGLYFIRIQSGNDYYRSSFIKE